MNLAPIADASPTFDLVERRDHKNVVDIEEQYLHQPSKGDCKVESSAHASILGH